MLKNRRNFLFDSIEVQCLNKAITIPFNSKILGGHSHLKICLKIINSVFRKQTYIPPKKIYFSFQLSEFECWKVFKMLKIAFLDAENNLKVF